jgi:2-polyprenyl-6-methoxyphenol hydroxylase-like FAD-dependent oxidoreductase
LLPLLVPLLMLGAGSSGNEDACTQGQTRVAIVGGSLGGLAAANALVNMPTARGRFTVDVFEKSTNTLESSGLGMGFVDVEAWEQLRGVSMMRRGRRASRSQGAFYYGDLWSYLFQGLPSHTVKFGVEVEDLGSDPTTRPVINGTPYDMVIIADGGWSRLRHLVTGAVTSPSYAGYIIWGGQLEAADVPGFKDFGVFKSGIYDTIVLPLATDSGRDGIMCGTFVATPPEEAEAMRPQTSEGRHAPEGHHGEADWFIPFYRQQFGQHAGGELVRLFDAVKSKGQLRPRAQYEQAVDRVSAGCLLLLGDAAHMATPRTAAGAHTAILDALALRAAFAVHDDPTDALSSYERAGSQRAQELFQRSREASQQFLPRQGGIVSPQTMVAGYGQQ